MTATNEVGAAAKAVVRRYTEDVQSKGSLELFEELIADDFVDHTPSPRQTTNKAGVRALYRVLREAFPDFRAEIHWQTADGDMVTTYKTYHGTHRGVVVVRDPPDRARGPVRLCRRHAGARRSDRRALGREQPVVPASPAGVRFCGGIGDAGLAYRENINNENDGDTQCRTAFSRFGPRRGHLMTPMILKVSLPFSPTTVCSRTTPLAMLLAAKT